MKLYVRIGAREAHAPRRLVQLAMLCHHVRGRRKTQQWQLFPMETISQGNAEGSEIGQNGPRPGGDLVLCEPPTIP